MCALYTYRACECNQVCIINKAKSRSLKGPAGFLLRDYGDIRVHISIQHNHKLIGGAASISTCINLFFF